MTDVMAKWAGKTVVVTGGLGFLGSHFTEELLAAGAEVVSLHRNDSFGRLQQLRRVPGAERLRPLRVDLLDENELRAAFRFCAPRVDAVFHCAALDGNSEFKVKNSARILDLNLRYTSNLLNCARDCGVGDVVLISSAEIYCTDSPAPITEEDDFRRTMRYSTNGYFLSKVFGEVLAELFRAQFEMNVFLVRPTNVYGPRDGFHGPVNRVIPSMLARIAAGEEIEIWGDGSQVRSFVYVTDMVRATLEMVAADRYRTFNIGSTESVAIVELARTLAEMLGEPERIHLRPDKPAGPSARRLDVGRMTEVISFVPRPLREGLAETVRWYQERQLATSGLAGRV
ncbi:NAD-dependent epimerase/dehydratase family protein [Amycolatopsis albispora]|uniref:Epimerase n=1 Tax=Amycolatopsis albispora TaxID=1804986 RepID=A0A344L5G3_9PSEU|nr:NAD(P)-dependent oxidoreductase [Amycolatopsis albispora]AXB43287.1 epimerase [Amycolatopsis albispora]